MQRRYVLAIWVFAAIVAGAGLAAAETVRLEDLDLGGMSSGWGKPQKNQSVTERPLGIGGQRFERGVGTHANSESWITLDGKTKSFTAKVGVDDNANNGQRVDRVRGVRRRPRAVAQRRVQMARQAAASAASI